MKKFFRRYKKLLISILTVCILIFVIPIVINLTFQMLTFLPILSIDWDDSDALGFYGELVSAAATIFVLHKTIQFTIDNQKEERKLSIRPYLVTRMTNYTDFKNIPNDDTILYINIQKGVISYQGEMFEEIIELKKLAKIIQDDNDKDLGTELGYSLKEHNFF